MRSISGYKFLFAANTEKKHKVCFPSFLFQCILFENVAVFACLLAWMGAWFLCFLNEHLLFSFLWVEVLWCLLGWIFSFFKILVKVLRCLLG